MGQSKLKTNNLFYYTARELEPETGDYYYRARYYDPKVGRFLSEDPISFASGDINHYRYVLNNPVRYTDPSGLFIGGFLNPGGNPGAIGSVGGTIIGGIFGGLPGAIVGGIVGGAIGAIFNTDPVGDNNDGSQGTPPSSCNPAMQSCFPNTPPPQPKPSC